MKAVAFDLGDTLVEYEGMPLSWEAHYPEALEHLAEFLKAKPNASQIAEGCAILRSYNTRIYPREVEFPFAAILAKLLPYLGITADRADESSCAMAFFRIFRQRLRCFPEVKATLEKLRRDRVRVGIFTDVPYGMPRSLVLEDIKQVSLENYYDVLLTSRDVSYRKPSVKTLGALRKELNCHADEMLHVGNEKKDIEVARAFGCRSILLDRSHHGQDWGQNRTIASLTEL